jgi:hypothetical protein
MNEATDGADLRGFALRKNPCGQSAMGGHHPTMERKRQNKIRENPCSSVVKHFFDF